MHFAGMISKKKLRYRKDVEGTRTPIMTSQFLTKNDVVQAGCVILNCSKAIVWPFIYLGSKIFNLLMTTIHNRSCLRQTSGGRKSVYLHSINICKVLYEVITT